MKKIFSIIALVALSAVPVLAQTVDCNAPIVDAAKILSPSDVSQIQMALPALERESVDAHVITYNLSANDSQENFLTRMQKSCGSWQNRAGGLKGNILVFMVSMTPKHTLGIFPGPNYQNSSLNFNVRADIKKNSIAPFLGSGNYGLGLANGIRQATQKIAAVQTASLPVQNSGPKTVIIKNEKPTDLSGFFSFLKWTLLVAVLVGLIFLVFYLLNKRKERKLAQLNAVAARNSVTALLSRLTDALREKAALGVKVSSSQAELDSISASFANLGSSLQYDPSDNTLSKEAYENIEAQYNSLLSDLKSISTDGDSATKKARKKVQVVASELVDSVVTETETNYPSFREPNYAPTPSYSSTPAAQPTGQVGQTTIIHEDHYHDDSSNLLAGVPVGEALSRDSYSQPVYREPAYTSTPSYAESSRDDSQTSFQDDSNSFEDTSNDPTSSFQDDSSSFDDSNNFDSGGFDSSNGGDF